MNGKRLVVFTCAALLMAVAAGGCGSGDDDKAQAAIKDGDVIKQQITEYYKSLKAAYENPSINIDSLNRTLYFHDMYYVTYWGTSEPIDTTMKRLSAARSLLKDYDYRLEIMWVRVNGDMASVFFTLRQNYVINGIPMQEYLPTTFVLERMVDGWKVVHAHRSADMQTIEALMQAARKSQ